MEANANTRIAQSEASMLRSMLCGNGAQGAMGVLNKTQALRMEMAKKFAEKDNQAAAFQALDRVDAAEAQLANTARAASLTAGAPSSSYSSSTHPAL